MEEAMALRLFKSVLCVAGFAASLSSGSVLAAACSGVSVGTSQTSDVTFAGAASDACVISTVNPQSGPNGDTSGFSGTFGSGLSLLGKVTSGSGSSTLDGVDFTWGFTQITGTTGTWSLMADRNVTLDLVFALHASDHSGAFLFDSQPLVANAVTPGTWTIHWLNNGGQVPDFSNLTLFARDVVMTPVPEPETYAMLLAGFAAMGFIARRRRTS
jgi:hypothetical protein